MEEHSTVLSLQWMVACFWFCLVHLLALNLLIPHSLTHSHLELELLDGATRVGVAAWEDLLHHLLIDVEVVLGLESRLL